MSKHTPGSWALSVDGVLVWRDDRAPCLFDEDAVARIGRFDMHDEFAANGRLIAAEPDLLAACEAVVACVNIDNLMLLGSREEDALELVEAALKKATDASPD